MSPALRTIASRHARTRMQQRGIRPGHVEVLLAGGCEHHDGRGGVVLCLDTHACRRLRQTGAARDGELDRLRGLYLVLADDGTIVTVGHRTRRVRRH